MMYVVLQVEQIRAQPHTCLPQPKLFTEGKHFSVMAGNDVLVVVIRAQERLTMPFTFYHHNLALAVLTVSPFMNCVCVVSMPITISQFSISNLFE